MISDSSDMATDGSSHSAAHQEVPAPAPAVAADPASLPNNQLLLLTLRLNRMNYSYWRSLMLAAVRAYDLD